ncbi:MAG TPA: glycosyltransferase [Candidatus Paceibacterota bacterium]|nr:glycosyltransferase [Candidatus Paceibacterota bacterium]
MKILYHIPHPKGLDAHRWIYEGWRDAFIDSGHEFFEITATDNIKDKIQNVEPHIFMSAVNILDVVRDLQDIKEARRKGMKLFLWVHWPPVKGFDAWNDLLKKEDVADVYFGEREPEGMYDFEQVTGKTYHVIANASNKKVHFPTKPVKKYEYDIVFLGANLKKKQQLFSEILKPLSKKYKVGLFGPGWTLKDKILRVVQKFMRIFHMFGLSNWVNKLRITVPTDEERELYSSAKISLNFHEREPDGSQPHYILNQRTFKIPACGGFEICDDVPALRRYFKEDELVMATMDPQDWFSKIEYYITHEEERNKIKNKGINRALKDHTYNNRVAQVLKLYNNLV